MAGAEDDNWRGASETLGEEGERQVLFAALDSFRQYRRAAHHNITHRRRQNFYALPEEQWQMLAGPPFNMLNHFNCVDDAIDANADIASSILDTGLAAFGVDQLDGNGADGADWKGAASPGDMEKAKSTLRQFYRDWSAEGEAERRSCHDPVLEDLVRLFPTADRAATRILIPGAGLGRFVFEVCKLGFVAEGNEISFHQLLGSNWILNMVKANEQYALYPFVLTFSNHLNRENQLRKVMIPDVHPGSVLDQASSGHTVHAFNRMSMTASDFIPLYSEAKNKAAFDVVTTIFFIDTAPNLIRYIETIRSTLKAGGYWINIGPLLWHFADASLKTSEHTGKKDRSRESGGIEEPGMFELAYEDVLLLIGRMGFDVQHQEVLDSGFGYIQDPESMQQTKYRCSHFIARKIK